MPEALTFESAGVGCAGLYYRPDGEALPAVAMAHGFSGVKEMDIPAFAERFAAAGIAVLLFDYRYFGGSAGEPRGRLHPAAQIEDYRNALSWLALRDEIDAERLGVWGTSFSGAHVLHLGAFDRRVKAVVSQIPAIDLYLNAQRLMTPRQFASSLQLIGANRLRQYATGELATMKVVAPEGEPCLLPSQESYENLTRLQATVAPSWRNVVTVDSIERILEYRPALSIELISPTPLLMIVGGRDALTPPEFALDAFARAREPKSLYYFNGGHYDAYRDPDIFEAASSRAAGWFRVHL
jgi:fermentation-respiration switch protein FrsA (DUF1100 family)